MGKLYLFSAATRLGCGGVFVYDFVTNFLLSLTERILKIGQYLVKLWARVRCFCFFDSRCIAPESKIESSVLMWGGGLKTEVGFSRP